jgi:hypothetical protein
MNLVKEQLLGLWRAGWSWPAARQTLNHRV